MSNAMCRLCSSSEKVVDVFHPDINSEYLQTIILLATGVNICRDDVVTKHVCFKCWDTTVELFKFRLKAMADDIALKHASKQTNNMSSTKVDRNATVVKTLLDNIEPTKQHDDYAVHPSMVQLIKTHQNLIVPNELLTRNLGPIVYLETLEQSPLEHEAIERTSKTEHIQSKILKANDLLNRPMNANSKPKANVLEVVKSHDVGKENLNGANKVELTRVLSKKQKNNVAYNNVGNNEVRSKDQTSNISPRRKRLRKSAFYSDYEYYS